MSLCRIVKSSSAIRPYRQDVPSAEARDPAQAGEDIAPATDKESRPREPEQTSRRNAATGGESRRVNPGAGPILQRSGTSAATRRPCPLPLAQGGPEAPNDVAVALASDGYGSGAAGARP